MGNNNSKYGDIKEKYIKQIPPLKRVLEKSGFLTYFFIQRPKIKHWNNESDLIKFKYFGTQISITDDFKSRLDNKFVTLLSKLKKHIEILVKSGWKMHFISIYEYNILINFKMFYDRYYQVFKSEELIKIDLLNLELAYVALTYRESYLDALFGIFEKYLIKYNSMYEDNSEKYDELFFNLKLLFQKSSLPYSLRELILAYNVAELHSFYKWSEIFPPISTDIVQKDWYNCDKEVQSELVGYYKTIKSSIRSLNNEKVRLLRLKSNCIINNDDSPPILKQFYESNKHSWELDNSSYYLMFLLLLEGLVSHLERFILREWKIIDDNEKLYSQRLVKDDDLPALYSKLKREVDMAFVYLNSDTTPGISTHDFRTNNNPESLINSEQQKKMFNSFKEILSIIYDISNKILSYGDIAIESGYTKNSYLNFMLDSPPRWAGKPVFSLFNYYVELLWTTCGFFKHETFNNMDSRLTQIDSEVNKLSLEIERLNSLNTSDGIEVE